MVYPRIPLPAQALRRETAHRVSQRVEAGSTTPRESSNSLSSHSSLTFRSLAAHRDDQARRRRLRVGRAERW